MFLNYFSGLVDATIRNGDVMNIRDPRLSGSSIINKLMLLTWLLLAFGTLAAAADVSSPDGRLVLTVDTTPTETNPAVQRLVYKVSFRGKELIEASTLR